MDHRVCSQPRLTLANDGHAPIVDGVIVTWNTADVPADRYVVIVSTDDERLDSRARRPVAAPGRANLLDARQWLPGVRDQGST
jgi:hypothetical protein